MKKIKQVILIITLIILSINNVKAEEYKVYRYKFANPVYAIFDGIDRIHIFDGESFRVNDEIAYCIEPGVNLYSNSYTYTSDLSITNLSKETIDKLKLIAYYGFSYTPGYHREDLYYMATQELIWNLITGRETYWVKTRDVNGERINIDRYKEEVMNLVNTHYVLPSFDNKEYEMELGKTYTINDDNEVLGRFKLVNPKSNIQMNKKRIAITPNSLDDNGEIELITNLYTDKDFFVYYSGDSQKLMSTEGKIEPITSKLKIKIVTKPMIKIIKIDSETKKPIKKAGIKFKIKDLDHDNYICENEECTYETDSEGIIITKNKFNHGNYQIEEVSEYIEGYLINKQPLKFTIDDNSNYIQKDNDLYLEYKFENHPVKGNVELLKIGEKPIFNGDTITYEDYQLDNVVFNLYANSDIYDEENALIYQNGTFINSIKTNDGKAILENLYLGDYCIKEVSTVDFHMLNKEPYCFSIKQENSLENVNLTIEIKNYLPKGTFDFTKLDDVTNEPLPDAGINIYNYKNELLLTAKTNEFGKIVINNIPIGRYYYVETEAPIGYTINSQKNYFEIKDNNQKISTSLVNEKYTVPSTKKNNSLAKNILILLIFAGICML